MSRIAVSTSVALIALAMSAIGAARAAAEPGPVRLVSKTSAEQADVASATAISADGRYLAFQARIGGLEGVFREDLGSGAIVPVAAASAFVPSPVRNSSAPSISADGRFVSFTTTAPLAPANDLQASSSDVYVADMSTSPPTYALASARDGTTVGLTYAGGGGSVAAGRVALSADGRKVAFVTTATSNLGGAAGDTPAGQVVLRDLDTNQTTLVSTVREADGKMTGLPVPGGAVATFSVASRGAALSADGTTVAWLGGHLPAQVPLLADERPKIENDDAIGNPFTYNEPLWRRIADGPEAPTRRIVGGGDPLAPGCPGSGTLAEPACDGPFPTITNKNNSTFDSALGWLGIANVDGVPALSADGRTVALIGNPEEVTDLFVVDMTPGLSRTEAVRPLTRATIVDPTNPSGTINLPPFIPINAPAVDVGISPDGKRIAFATARQQFPLAPPNLVGAPPAQVGQADLYLVDLEGESIQRLTHGVGGVGEASLGGGAASPSFGNGGQTIAFASSASNLALGDANGSSDAFVVEDPRVPVAPGEVEISPPPAGPQVKRAWRLTLSATSLPDGDVRLVAVVPGPGALSVRSQAELVPGERARTLVSRQVRARAAEPVRLTLAPPSRLRRLTHSSEGLYASVGVLFRSPRGKPLRGSLTVRFHAVSRRGVKGGGRR